MSASWIPMLSRCGSMAQSSCDGPVKVWHPAYYAAYSKVTHELVAIAGLPMPPGREGPGHSRIRSVVETSMPNMAQAKRDKLSEMLGRLYTLRIDADYRPSVAIGATEARAALSLMTTVFDAF